jgi:hypothetical protein
MFKAFVLLIASGFLFALVAVPPSIGVANSSGEFRVDGSVIQGNSTLFDGTVIETTSARSVLRIAGAQVTLLPDSRAKVYRDHAIIEKGSGIVAHAQHLTVEAASLRIAPSAGDAVVQVEKTGQAQVVVATTAGSAEVRNASGVLIASLNPHMALAFDSAASSGQTGAAAGAVKLTGVVQTAGGNFFLTDSTTGVKVELRGDNLARYAGTTVTFSGSIIPGEVPAAGASQVVQVVSIDVVRSAAPGTAVAAGAGGHLAPVALPAVIGGVAVTMTVVSLYSVTGFTSVRPLSTP